MMISHGLGFINDILSMAFKSIYVWSYLTWHTRSLLKLPRWWCPVTELEFGGLWAYSLLVAMHTNTSCPSNIAFINKSCSSSRNKCTFWRVEDSFKWNAIMILNCSCLNIEFQLVARVSSEAAFPLSSARNHSSFSFALMRLKLLGFHRGIIFSTEFSFKCWLSRNCQITSWPFCK